MRKNLLCTITLLSVTQALFQGFNSGASFSDGSIKQQADFEKKILSAKEITGCSANSVRLYTSIQGGSNNLPIEAIPAALKASITILIGIWASADQSTVSNKIHALKTALARYGENLVNNIISISVGSENIYRFINPGVGIGASPSSILGYIGQVREALKDTGLTDIKIGHVDTWGAWVDPITKDLIDICDFIGIDVYPYFEATASNSINNAQNLFFSALNKTKSAMGCKPIWVTETGWPISGSIFNQAVPSIENARIYWKNVGWAIVGSTNTWWYIL